MKITKPKRAQRASKRLDLSDMRELFRDRRVFTAIGIVGADDGGAHWEQLDKPADIVIEVVLQPSLMPVSCRLAAGIWTVPEEGEEVAVMMPEGSASFMPVIIALLSSNNVPTAQGPAPGRIVIHRDQVFVHDGNGNAVALAKHASVQALADAFYGHGHPANGAPPTPSFDPLSPPIPLPDPLPAQEIEATTCLFAK